MPMFCMFEFQRPAKVIIQQQIDAIPIWKELLSCYGPTPCDDILKQQEEDVKDISATKEVGLGGAHVHIHVCVY